MKYMLKWTDGEWLESYDYELNFATWKPLQVCALKLSETQLETIKEIYAIAIALGDVTIVETADS